MSQAYAYARVSTAEQASGMSLDGQVRTVEQYASSKGYEVVQTFVDRGVSGTAADRPAFQDMIERLLSPANKVEAVIVVHTSRFMREDLPGY
jgi:DNA invertase Pin-like site-specific DNA recombinase